MGTFWTSPLGHAIRRHVPEPIRPTVWALYRRANRRLNPLSGIDFGSLRRTRPYSRAFGFDRGLPVDRYYIEQFLAKFAADIRGHVLEMADDMYTRRFGGNAVERSDVLDVDARARRATIVADLTEGSSLRSDAFDCIIFTHTLQVIYDVRSALLTLHRILRPGGVLLAAFPGISQLSREDVEKWGEFWRFTSLSARRLFEEAFPSCEIRVDAYGNVLAATAVLYGIASQELSSEELDERDADYEVVICVRVVKQPSAP